MSIYTVAKDVLVREVWTLFNSWPEIRLLTYAPTMLRRATWHRHASTTNQTLRTTRQNYTQMIVL